MVADRFMMLDERLCDDDEERYIGRVQVDVGAAGVLTFSS